MSSIQNARRATVAVKYAGKNVTQQLAAFLTGFSYNDAAPGEQDKITINLDDRERKWIKAWKPVLGDRIVAEVNTTDWEKAKDKGKIKCGSFELESIDLSGPPNLVTLTATALPKGGSAALRQVRTKGWEKVKFRSVAQEIANRCKLKLSYNIKINPTYDRLDQNEQTDLDFLTKLCSDEGVAIKITTGSLVLFDEAEFEKTTPVMQLEYGKSNILSWSFSMSDSDTAYSACVVTYKPPVSSAKKKKAADKKKKGKTDKPDIPLDPDLPTPKTFSIAAAADKKKEAKKKVPITATYRIPGVDGPVLRINQEVASVAEAQRLAKNKLREKNKGAGVASFSLDGNTQLASGVTVWVKGYGMFDGKYLVLSVDQKVVGGAFQTDVKIRKVLAWG
ncbi:phage late control D family protein [Paenibacillus sp. UASWS1643]|uniref:phage late control D family protein n=1 Tax=Paenibacillus sp. UASWS1643 TaxID=2580422 RepID=UPI0016820C18|nr:contractile injection system protein, VgrG/Pvc8 family [Paenibacillus sp. UASWS1643]